MQQPLRFLHGLPHKLLVLALPCMLFPLLIQADTLPAAAGHLDIDAMIIVTSKDDLRLNVEIIIPTQTMTRERIKPAHALSGPGDQFRRIFSCFG